MARLSPTTLVVVFVVALASTLWALSRQPTLWNKKDSLIVHSKAMRGIFKHKATNDMTEDYRIWVQEVISSTTPYPKNRFHGQGIVVSAGGKSLCTQLYVFLRVLRDTHRCTLPVEVFYIGADEMPSTYIRTMNKMFKDVRFVDVLTVPDAFAEVHDNRKSDADKKKRNWHLPAVSWLLSSFEEVIWLDVDNIPTRDPRFLLKVPAYQKMGALFWPDLCNIYSAHCNAWKVYGLPEPPADFPCIKNTPVHSNVLATKGCHSNYPREFETGQAVFHKRKTWKAIVLIAFVGAHHHFFYENLVFGYKLVAFEFNATGTPYHLAPSFIPLGMIDDGDSMNKFCVTTYGHRHPVKTDEILFLHRTGCKFHSAEAYMDPKNSRARAWEKTIDVEPYTARLTKALIRHVPWTDDVCSQAEIYPNQYSDAPQSIKDLEDTCLSYLHEYTKLQVKFAFKA